MRPFLQPHYRGLGLYGSEYHTFSWTHRSGEARMKQFSRDMLPMSVEQAREAGLVDHVIRHSQSKPSSLTQQIKECVVKIMTATSADAAVGADSVLTCGAKWTKSSELESEQSLLSARMLNNKYQYLSKLFDEPASDPTAFMKHFETFREEELQQMVLDFWHVSCTTTVHGLAVWRLTTTSLCADSLTVASAIIRDALLLCASSFLKPHPRASRFIVASSPLGARIKSGRPFWMRKRWTSSMVLQVSRPYWRYLHGQRRPL